MPTQSNLKKWSIFFLISATNEYYPRAINLIKEVLSNPIHDDISIAICITINNQYLNPLLTVRQNDTHIHDSTFFLKVVKKDLSSSELKIFEEHPAFDLRKGSDVGYFFKKAIKECSLSERNMIITWDHGSPVGVFNADSETTQTHSLKKNSGSINNSSDYNPSLTHFRLMDFYKSEILPKVQTNEITAENKNFTQKIDSRILTITELKNAFLTAFGKIKIDILIMENCNLQFFDTGFELSNSVDYLIAFESYMFFKYSMDYRLILKTLSFTPGMTSDKISKVIVSSFEIKANSNTEGNDNNLKDSVALFANDLNWYPVMGKLINDLALKMTESLPIYYEKVLAARKKCDYLIGTIKQYCLIDFKSFILALYNELPAIFEGKFELFMYLFKNIVIESYVGSAFMENTTKLQCPSCFSIYFPLEKSIYNSPYRTLFMDQNAKLAPLFVKLFYWDDFIEAFVKFGTE